MKLFVVVEADDWRNIAGVFSSWKEANDFALRNTTYDSNGRFIVDGFRIFVADKNINIRETEKV